MIYNRWNRNSKRTIWWNSDVFVLYLQPIQPLKCAYSIFGSVFYSMFIRYYNYCVTNDLMIAEFSYICCNSFNWQCSLVSLSLGVSLCSHLCGSLLITSSKTRQKLNQPAALLILFYPLLRWIAIQLAHGYLPHFNWGIDSILLFSLQNYV